MLHLAFRAQRKLNATLYLQFVVIRTAACIDVKVLSFEGGWFASQKATYFSDAHNFNPGGN
jgi:hypothetical protein